MQYRRTTLAFALSLIAAASLPSLGCATGHSPSLRVLGVHEQARREVVFVQVTNPASRPMRLTKLEYRFAAGKATVAQGELEIWREVPAGEAIVVEVPLEDGGAHAGEAPITLRGKLTAVTDEITRIFTVTAEVQPQSADLEP